MLSKERWSLFGQPWGEIVIQLRRAAPAYVRAVLQLCLPSCQTTCESLPAVDSVNARSFGQRNRKPLLCALHGGHANSSSATSSFTEAAHLFLMEIRSKTFHSSLWRARERSEIPESEALEKRLRYSRKEEEE